LKFLVLLYSKEHGFRFKLFDHLGSGLTIEDFLKSFPTASRQRAHNYSTLPKQFFQAILLLDVKQTTYPAIEKLLPDILKALSRKLPAGVIVIQ
jgi:hypothetical protein